MLLVILRFPPPDSLLAETNRVDEGTATGILNVPSYMHTKVGCLCV